MALPGDNAKGPGAAGILSEEALTAMAVQKLMDAPPATRGKLFTELMHELADRLGGAPGIEPVELEMALARLEAAVHGAIHGMSGAESAWVRSEAAQHGRKGAQGKTPAEGGGSLTTSPPPTRVPVLSGDQMKALFAQLNPESPEGSRRMCLFALLWETDWAADEVVNIKLRDIKCGITSGEVILSPDDEVKKRAVLLSRETILHLARHISEHHRHSGPAVTLLAKECNGRMRRMSADKVRKLLDNFLRKEKSQSPAIPG